jgi:hypothetical protein
MGIALSTNVGSPARQRVVRFLACILVASATVVSLRAQELRPVPRFEGKTMPEPPNLGRPWTAPATKLPKFLVTATGILFEQGVADPRGCEYREVEVGGDWIVKAHGFVLPERAEKPGRFVICWDGQVYPALTVGAPADLDRDVQNLAASMKQAHDAAQSNRFNQGFSWSFSRERPIPFGAVGIDDNSPLKLCLLLRLGRADLAEALFAAGTSWTPDVRARDLTDYGISYLTLAVDWAGSAFKRLIAAHVRGDDVIALGVALKLAKFRDQVAARADAMGFPRPDRSDAIANGAIPRFYFLNQLDDLLRDQERRAKMPARGPIPGKRGDPSARIAALIRDLDQINVQQMSPRGAAYPGQTLLVFDLIASGDAAVPPLLAVLESDNRLTRSVSNGRGGSLQHFVHPVTEAALAALIGILKTHEFDGQRFFNANSLGPAARKALAASVRQFWEQTRAVPLVERWYRTLLDDSAGPARWLEAAGAIVQQEVKPGMPLPKPGSQPMQGEPLRGGREPSVTDLMIRRAAQIERMGNPQMSYDQEFARACQMGSILSSWEKKSSLPILKDLMQKCRARSDYQLAQADDTRNADRTYASYLAKFTELRVEIGDLEVLDEYASWLRTTTPKMLEYARLDAWQPLLVHADHPALASAAQWLFNDPKSPWVPILPEARAQQAPPFQDLIASPLIIVGGFRSGVFTGLADKAPLGSITRRKSDSIERKIKGIPTTNFNATNLNLEGVAVGVEYPFRRCDFLASKLSELEGCPRFDLFWPEARRDEGVAACVAYLKRFGPSLTAKPPAGDVDYSGPRAHLRFPTLGKPATPEDVTSVRAIFSLAGEGESRSATMPAFPLKAKWLTLKDTPVVRTYVAEGSGKAVTRHEYDTDGYVWQAEEVRKGDRWERFYGFVGHHVVSRAPASEIEFASGFNPWWWNLKGGLDARTEMVSSPTTSYEPGRPILVAVYIRNRLGTNQASPIEFIARASDGKPALRKGINISLWQSMSRGPGSGPNQAYPRDVVQPRRHDRFDPGDATRSLAPLESFEAMRLDLNDWFDLTRPGQYRFRVSFTTDSGVGEGSATEAHFQVGGEE